MEGVCTTGKEQARFDTQKRFRGSLPGTYSEQISSNKHKIPYDTMDLHMILQDSMYQTGNYSVLEVEQDCVRMSKFIETKLNCKFEDGKAFYEMTENEEDLLYYKKSLRPKKDEVFSCCVHGFRSHINSKLYMQLGCEELKLESLIEYFYAIPGVPSKAFKPTQLIAGLEHCKVFIQSTSQGSRCLKAGTKILYLKEVHCTLAILI